MIKTVICVALIGELQALFPGKTLKKEPGDQEIYAITSDIYALVTGIGMVNAASSLAVFIEKHKPERILNFGFAGATADSLKRGQVVTPKSVIHANSYILNSGNREYYQHGTSIRFRKEISPYLQLKPLNIKSAKEIVLASDGGFVVDPLYKKQIFSETKAEALDMELYALTQIALRYKKDISSIKVISEDSTTKTGENDFFKSFDDLKSITKKIGEMFVGVVKKK